PPPSRPAAGEREVHRRLATALADGPGRRADPVLGRGAPADRGDVAEPGRVRNPTVVRVQRRARGGARGAGRRRGVRPPGRRDAVQGEPVVPAAADGQRGAADRGRVLALPGGTAGGREVRCRVSDRVSLLRAILADPDDDVPRLVFADWLEE